MSIHTLGKLLSFAILSLSTTTIIETTIGARAEVAGKEQTAAKPSEAELGPCGEHMPREIKYSAWRKVCFKAPNTKMLCRTISEGRWETGQVAVRVDVIERADGRGRLQIFVPVGLYLQPGVKVTIDQGTSITAPYSWCLTNTCIAAIPADTGFIRAMEAGQKLTLVVVDSNILSVETSLPLNQFATVRNGPPAQTFEYLLDNE